MAKYALNFAPLTLEGSAKVLIGQQPYDRDRLNDLRAEFRDTHVFHRDGKNNVIMDLPIVPGREPLGNIQEEADLATDRRLWPALLSTALVKSFSGVRDLLPGRTVSVVGAVQRGLLHHPDLPDWIQRRTVLRFDSRTIHTNNKGTLGLVCETSLKSFIHAPCAVLIEHGIPLVGRYVLIAQPANDARFMDRMKLVGRVVSISGSDLILDDHAEGYATIATDRAFLEPRRETVDDCVQRLLGDRARAVLDEAEKQASAFHSGPGRKEQIADALKYLREKTTLEAVPGVKFVIGEMLSAEEKSFPVTETIAKPVLVFDPSGTRKDDWNERGLKKSGPYDQRTFTPKQLRIAVVCQARHEGRVDAFTAKFLEGMPNALTGKKREARYGDGLLRRFALDKPSITFFTAAGSSAEDYATASREALARAADEGFKWDLALVQVEEEFKATNGGANPTQSSISTIRAR